MFKKPPTPFLHEEVESEYIDLDIADPESGTISEICRICLSDGDIPIFGAPSISEDINKFGGIQMTEDDGLPQHICKACLELLKSAVHFNTIAMESDRSLRVKEKFDFSDEISFTHEEDSQESDSASIDQNSDISRVYLDCDSSGDECTTLDSKSDTASIGDEVKEANPKDMYMVIVSDNETKSNVGFHCELCNLTLKTPDEINKHVLTHDPETCKKCQICNNIMEITVYEIHMKLHKEAFKQRIAKNKAECKICGKVVTKTYMKYHMKGHGTSEDKKERMKQCTVCDKIVSYNYYNDHMKRVHGKPQYNDTSQDKAKQCPICDRTFKEVYFNKHVASHGRNRKQYICDQCGREFKHYSAFHTHTLTHGADLKYKCQFCPYRGLHLGLLKVHVRTHTGDYLYECSTCNKKFLTKSNLSVHERRHKAPDTFVCPECSKGFYTQRNLNKHYNMIHLGIRDEKCEICGKAFGHRDGLLAHQKQVHKRKSNHYKGRVPSYLKAEQNVQSTANEEGHESTTEFLPN